jgi:hypothetical protein
LEFEFKSDVRGEIHGIGFDYNTSNSSQWAFQLHGSQTWGVQTHANYQGGSGWKAYKIFVGQEFTGSFDRLVFIMDHDGGSGDGESEFRNMRIYEN